MGEVRRRGRPREVALDERILDSTLRLMKGIGYAHMSMDDIATAAHTTRATIYLRYSSKEALAAAAIVYARRAVVLPPPSGILRSDLVAQLRHFQESMAASYSLPLIWTMMAEEHTTPELLAVLREQVVASRRQMLRSILQEARARRELTLSVDIDLAVAQLIGSYYALSIAGEPVPPDWAERVVDQMLAGIVRDSTRDRDPG